MIINRVSRLMGERRLSIQKVVERSGLAYSTVHDLYHGKAKRVDLKTLDRLCRALDAASLSDLLEYVEDDPAAFTLGMLVGDSRPTTGGPDA